MPQQQVCCPVHRRGPTWVPAAAQLTFPCSRMRCTHNAAQAAAAPRVWRAACRCFPWAYTSVALEKEPEASVYLFLSSVVVLTALPLFFLFSAGVQSKEAGHRVALGCPLHPALEPASRDESPAADPAWNEQTYRDATRTWTRIASRRCPRTIPQAGEPGARSGALQKLPSSVHLPRFADGRHASGRPHPEDHRRP